MKLNRLIVALIGLALFASVVSAELTDDLIGFWKFEGDLDSFWENDIELSASAEEYTTEMDALVLGDSAVLDLESVIPFIDALDNVTVLVRMRFEEDGEYEGRIKLEQGSFPNYIFYTIIASSSQTAIFTNWGFPQATSSTLIETDSSDIAIRIQPGGAAELFVDDPLTPSASHAQELYDSEGFDVFAIENAKSNAEPRPIVDTVAVYNRALTDAELQDAIPLSGIEDAIFRLSIETPAVKILRSTVTNYVSGFVSFEMDPMNLPQGDDVITLSISNTSDNSVSQLFQSTSVFDNSFVVDTSSYTEGLYAFLVTREIPSRSVTKTTTYFTAIYIPDNVDNVLGALDDRTASFTHTGFSPNRALFDLDAAPLIIKKQASDIISVYILSAQGKRVRTLAQNYSVNDTEVRLVWDGRNDNGADLSPGVYYARVLINDTQRISKVMKTD